VSKLEIRYRVIIYLEGFFWFPFRGFFEDFNFAR
jgi:hypothetical protein